MVKYIRYNEKDYPVRVSYFALKRLKEDIGKSVSELGEDDYEGYESLLYYSLQRGAKMTGVSFDFKKEDMEDVMDECFFRFLEIVPQFFQSEEDYNKSSSSEIQGGNKGVKRNKTK